MFSALNPELPMDSSIEVYSGADAQAKPFIHHGAQVLYEGSYEKGHSSTSRSAKAEERKRSNEHHKLFVCPFSTKINDIVKSCSVCQPIFVSCQSPCYWFQIGQRVRQKTLGACVECGGDRALNNIPLFTSGEISSGYSKEVMLNWYKQVHEPKSPSTHGHNMALIPLADVLVRYTKTDILKSLKAVSGAYVIRGFYFIGENTVTITPFHPAGEMSNTHKVQDTLILVPPCIQLHATPDHHVILRICGASQPKILVELLDEVVTATDYFMTNYNEISSAFNPPLMRPQHNPGFKLDAYQVSAYRVALLDKIRADLPFNNVDYHLRDCANSECDGCIPEPPGEEIDLYINLKLHAHMALVDFCIDQGGADWVRLICPFHQGRHKCTCGCSSICRNHCIPPCTSHASLGCNCGVKRVNKHNCIFNKYPCICDLCPQCAMLDVDSKTYMRGANSDSIMFDTLRTNAMALCTPVYPENPEAASILDAIVDRMPVETSIAGPLNLIADDPANGVDLPFDHNQEFSIINRNDMDHRPFFNDFP